MKRGILIPFLALAAASAQATWEFNLSVDQPVRGATDVPLDCAYSGTRGYGYEYRDGAEDPFVFSVKVPEGTYRVRAQLLGDGPPVSIKAETRRVMIANAQPPCEVEFTVHVRTPKLAGGGEVSLNPREEGIWHWDDRLQLEFNGERVRVGRLEIAPASGVTTVFIAGDSTVTDQRSEPWAGWGQILPMFFDPSVAVANYAESGLALKTFREQHRLDKVLEQMKPGDYVLIQFGHNDMKEKGEGIGPWQSYSDDLRDYVEVFRAKGGKPILVTSMKRRRFDSEGRQFATLGDYPLAVRRVAAELGVPLIDLNQMSATLYSALGPEGSKDLFVHFPAGTYATYPAAAADDSHFRPYGAWQLAKCVVEGIRLAAPELATHLRSDATPYDPASPDPMENWTVPPSRAISLAKPDGN